MNYNLLSLSDLSLVILNHNSSNFDKLEASKEIQRRFKRYGCDYDQFMYYEKKVISKRGEGKENYLIQSHPTAQQLMEIYFTYIYNQSFIHDNILFSEVHLCNNDSNKTFFDKLLEVEIDNLKERIDNPNKMDDREKLEWVHGILLKQKNRQGIWYENAATDMAFNISSKMFNFSEKVENKKAAMDKYEKTKLATIMLYSRMPYILFQNSSLGEYTAIHKFLLEDSMKLVLQQRRLVKDFRNGTPVDYSFIGR